MFLYNCSIGSKINSLKRDDCVRACLRRGFVHVLTGASSHMLFFILFFRFLLVVLFKFIIWPSLTYVCVYKSIYIYIYISSMRFEGLEKVEIKFEYHSTQTV
jgi:hypothetical protein